MQLIAIIVLAIVDANFIFLPRIAAEHAGRDGWLSIILSGFVVLLTATLIYYLCRRFPNRILPEFSITILGKPLGILVTLLYVIYTLLLAGITLRLFTEVTKTWTMFWTPQSFFIIVLLLPAVYIVRQGPITLGRISELFLFSMVLVLLLLLVPVRQFNVLHLKPVGQSGLMAISSAVPGLLSNYRGFEILLVLFPLVVNRERVFRLYIIAISLVIVMSAGSTLLAYGIMGVEHSQVQVWPFLEYMASERLQIIERVDNFFLFFWTFQIIALVAAQYYATVVSISSLTKIHYSLWTWLLWPAVFAVAVFPDNVFSMFYYSRQMGYWGEIFIFGLVLLLLLVAVIRGLDERTGGS